MTQSQQTLLITAGDGPSECNMAVGHILKRMEEEAALLGLDLSSHATKGRDGPKSVVVVAHGLGAAAFAKTWQGTIQWRMKSPVRKHHKRSNWFVGVFQIAGGKSGGLCIQSGDVSFSTLRAGGPGGQHQNTTDSAVRAVHEPTGLTVVVREARSQHRNKAQALERLQTLADAKAVAEAEHQKATQNQLHRTLERGNPVRCFKGAGFVEV